MTPCAVAAARRSGQRRGFHDSSAQGAPKTGRGNNWVMAAIVVRLPFTSRPVALPVLAKLVVKGTNSRRHGYGWPGA
jgi:hypothetical protein